MKGGPLSAFQVFAERLDSLGLRDSFETIAKQQGVLLHEVYSKDERKRSAVIARARCYQQLSGMGQSLKDIGMLFDRDHTTVLGALRTHSNGHGWQNSEPSSDDVSRKLPLLISMAREFERTADETKSDYIRGKAEGIRTVIRLLFPLSTKEGA